MRWLGEKKTYLATNLNVFCQLYCTRVMYNSYTILCVKSYYTKDFIVLGQKNISLIHGLLAKTTFHILTDCICKTHKPQ